MRRICEIHEKRGKRKVDGDGVKFKIGDIVKGNKMANDKYDITDSSCIGEVIETNEFGIILLKLISHEKYKDHIGETYIVEDDYFDLVTTNGWTGLYGIANYKKLFSIENGVPVVSNVGKDSPCYRQLCAEYEEFLKNEKEKEA